MLQLLAGVILESNQPGYLSQFLEYQKELVWWGMVELGIVFHLAQLIVEQDDQ